MFNDLARPNTFETLQVGGIGIRVEIDETYLNKRKLQSAPFARASSMADRADHVVRRWAWGAVEGIGRAAGGHCIVVLLDVDLDHPRGMPALMEALLRHVRPGSRIIHDDWGAYLF